jgi:hypothetical protein
MAPKPPKAAEPAPRTFALRAQEEGGVTRVSFGCAPRVSLGAGDKHTTTDPQLAARMAADPLLEELS